MEKFEIVVVALAFLFYPLLIINLLKWVPDKIWENKENRTKEEVEKRIKMAKICGFLVLFFGLVGAGCFLVAFFY